MAFVSQPTGVKKRRLSDDEYRVLGRILQERAADDQFKTAVQIIRCLALSACRRGEAIHLKPSEVDVNASCLRLVDSKEGASVRPVGLPVLDLLALPVAGEDYGLVFKGTVEGSHSSDFRDSGRNCSRTQRSRVSRRTFFATASPVLPDRHITWMSPSLLAPSPSGDPLNGFPSGGNARCDRGASTVRPVRTHPSEESAVARASKCAARSGSTLDFPS